MMGDSKEGLFDIIVQLRKDNLTGIKINTSIKGSIDIRDVSIHHDREKLFKQPNIYKHISRGMCFVFIDGVLVYHLEGHPKFEQEKHFIFNEHSTTDIIVAQTKLNGESAHVGAFMHNDIQYIVVGSKNVHIVVRANNYIDDIEMYSELRYMWATRIAKLFHTIPTFDLVVRHLIEHCYTFCFEACFTSRQHFVRYVEDSIIAYAITGRQFRNSDALRMNYQEANTIFISLGIAFAPVLFTTETITKQQIEQEVRQMKNNEGVIMLRINSEGKVIHCFKFKTDWYMNQRALREMMKGNENLTENDIIRCFKKYRLSPVEISRFVDFNTFYQKSKPDGFFDRWIFWWDTFDARQEEKQTAHAQCFVLIFVGPPGIGKTTLAKEILLHTGGTYIEQDQYAGNKHAFMTAYKKLVQQRVPLIIVSRTNHTKRARSELCEFSMTQSYTHLIVEFDWNSQQQEQIISFCVNRVVERTNHPTLGNDAKLANKVVSMFVGQYQHPDETEGPIISVPFDGDLKMNTTHILSSMHTHGFICSPPVVMVPIEQISIIQRHSKKSKIIYFGLWLPLDCINLSDLLDQKTRDCINTTHMALKFAELHTTLWFHTNKTKPEMKIGEHVSVKITGYACDEKAVAFTVIVPDEYQLSGPEKKYHITFALAEGTKPKYSNSLLETTAIVEFDTPYVVEMFSDVYPRTAIA